MLTSASFDATADTYVRNGADDTNEGASTFLRLQSSGNNRPLVRFDQSAMQSFIGGGTVTSATLRLTITDPGNNWGPNGRPVNVHRLTSDWAEGNGFTPSARGTGSGATWNCAVDSDIANEQKNCSGATEWEMGQPNQPQLHPWVQTATSSATIMSNQTGVVEWDVTADVVAFHGGSATNYGWIVIKADEGQAGQADFGSRQNATPGNRPVLIITINPAPTNTPTPTSTSTATATSTSTATSTATSTSTSTATPTATSTPTSTNTPTVTQTVLAVANPDSANATGNVQINVLASAGVLVNDSPPAATVTSFGPSTGTETPANSQGSSAAGGTVTVNNDGSFSYDPPAGFNGNDTFVYTITFASQSASATVTITVTDMIWFIDTNPGACVSSCDGRLTHPFITLGSFQGVNSGGSPNPQPNQPVFLYESSVDYVGPVTLRNGQKLIGQDATTTLEAISGVTPATYSLPFPTLNSGNATIARITSATDGVIAGSGNLIRGLTIGDSVNGTKLSGSSFGTLTVSEVTLSGLGQALNLSTGTLNAAFDSVSSTSGANNIVLASVAGTLTAPAGSLIGATGRAVDISASSLTFSYGASVTNTGTGISLVNDTGATIGFSGALSLTTGANAAFTATGGGTVSATNTTSTLTTTMGTALTVSNSTIGAGNLVFRSISANGAANGIVLNNTGTSGGLQVLGGGSTTQGGDASGGTIQSTTGAGVTLTNTSGVQLNNLTVTNTANAPGITGTGVSGFALTNSEVSNSGGTSHGTHDYNIDFGTGTGVANVSGVVTITNSELLTAYQGGVDVLNALGTVSDLNVSNNLISSSTSSAQSVGSGIRVQIIGTTLGSAAKLTKGELNLNTIQNFPSGNGISVTGGNVTGAGAAATTLGTSGNDLQIQNNSINGQSAENAMGLHYVIVSLSGFGTGFLDVSGNGSASSPTASAMSNVKGTGVSINATGAATLTVVANNNVVSGTGQSVVPAGANGIGGGADKQVLGDTSTADSAVMNLTATGNAVSTTDGNGIYFLANSRGVLNAKVQTNTVGAPVTGSRPAIRIDSGSSAGTAVDTNVCLLISGNTAAPAGAFFDGIAIRKQGNFATTNDFGLVGLAPSPATDAQTEAFLRGQNPTETTGAAGGSQVVSHGANLVYTSCSLGF
jgi:hypothetical protein